MHTKLQRYGFALLTVLVAALIRSALIPLFGYRYGFSFFLVSTFVSARYAGFKPSLFALFAGSIPPFIFHFLPREQNFDSGFQIATIAYFALGGVIVFLSRSEFKVRTALQKEIADRKLIETELRESKHQLSLAMEAAQLGTWQLDMQSNEVKWSGMMESMHGYAPGTFGNTLAEAIAHNHPEDQAHILRGLANHQRPPRATYRVLLADGQIRWIQGIGRTLTDAAGKRMRMYGVCLDVTEQKESEIAIRLAEERFRTLATHAPVGIFQNDKDGRCIFVNDKWCEITGVSAEEALVDGGQMHLHPEDRDECMAQWNAATSQGQSFHADCRIVHPQRGIRWVSGSATPIVAPSGAMSGYVGTVVDMTDRKNAEDAVRRSEARLKGILDHTTAVIYLKDLEGRYLLVNRRWEELFNRDQATILGLTNRQRFPKETADQFQDNDQKVMQSGEPIQVEETAELEDGLHTYITVKFPIRNSNGDMIGIGGISTDITDRKNAIEALEAEQQLLRHTVDFQDHERQLVAYEIHDGLVQYATGALMQLEAIHCQIGLGPMAERIGKVVEILKVAIAEGRRLIYGIRTPVLDDWGIVAAIEQLIEQVDRTQVQVEFVKDDVLERMERRIEETIYRIAQEALTNVHKHSRAKRVRIELGRRAERIRLVVRDWGIGFTPSQRIGVIHGVRGMTERARLAGGHCSIESSPGHGTQLILELPFSARVDQGHERCGAAAGLSR